VDDGGGSEVKVKLWVSILKPERGGYEYPGGVRTAVHLSNRDALLDLCEWAYEDDEHDEQDDEDEGIPDFPNAGEDELEEYLDRCRDNDLLASWGVDEFEIDLPGTPSEQIAAILKAHCERGDELHAEEILREARGQFIRESDECPYCKAIGRSQDDCEGEDCKSREVPNA
jgi:hypothetical protein